MMVNVHVLSTTDAESVPVVTGTDRVFNFGRPTPTPARSISALAKQGPGDPPPIFHHSSERML